MTVHNSTQTISLKKTCTIYTLELKCIVFKKESYNLNFLDRVYERIWNSNSNAWTVKIHARRQ